ncbi:type II toxin-antitoxin system Phd/YefM family antitoxin [Chromohalobacter israelensis]|uniref:type II toxin-antitoxin system Phd/YefM family antitoxin n=1 Tax=Chromohalobacter israelensis TaxID=141390 RepID=UPI0005586404|nr:MULTISPECIES: type II toxin-antitoxin system Phd/YefM family antitoxin [Chromohalobacter]MDF9435595.1 type II toxin-antitoxin system Phd/YefM family antitoxin [Chromohalobacter israelensis]RXE48133.1 Phd-YefM [Chromohalobacter salexigens]
MATLLERPEEAVSATAMARNFSNRLKEISSRHTERLVIFKDNQPAAVLMNVQAYQDLVDELEDLRIEAVARDRLASYQADQAIDHDDMRALFDRSSES